MHLLTICTVEHTQTLLIQSTVNSEADTKALEALVAQDGINFTHLSQL